MIKKQLFLSIRCSVHVHRVHSEFPLMYGVYIARRTLQTLPVKCGGRCTSPATLPVKFWFGGNLPANLPRVRTAPATLPVKAATPPMPPMSGAALPNPNSRPFATWGHSARNQPNQLPECERCPQRGVRIPRGVINRPCPGDVHNRL